ncbi:MAG: DUF3592 domain-containing protein [Planctomycetota bacterium]
MTSQRRPQARKTFRRSVRWLQALLVCGVAGLFFMFALYGLGRDIHRMITWRPVEAEVTAYRPPDPGADVRGHEPHGRIDYRYTWRGSRLENHYPRETSTDFPRLPFRVTAQPHKPGDTIRAWVDPSRPGRSTLELRIEPYAVLLLVFVMPFGLLAGSLLLRCLGRRGVFRRGELEGGGSIAFEPWFLTYISASAMLSFAGAMTVHYVSWQTGLALAMALLVGVCPALAWITHRVMSAKPRGPMLAKRPKVRRRMLGVGLASVFWWGVTAVMVGGLVSTFVRHKIAQQTFLPTQGQVLRSHVREIHDSSDVDYEPFVEYRYTVDGKTYTSHRIDFGDGGAISNRHAVRQIRPYPRGVTVTAFYDPDDPASAVLETRFPTFYYIASIWVIPFVVLGFVLIGAIFSSPSHERHADNLVRPQPEMPAQIPTWGLLREEHCVLEVTPTPSPWRAFAMVLMALSAAAAIVLGVYAGVTGVPDSLRHAAGWTFLGIGGASVFTWLWIRFRPRARLRIDLAGRTLTLARPAREDIQLLIESIDEWLSGEIPNPARFSRKWRKTRSALAVRAGLDIHLLHVFQPDEFGDTLARRVADLFARRTGKKHTSTRLNGMPQRRTPREVLRREIADLR